MESEGWRSRLNKLNTQKQTAKKKSSDRAISEICGSIGDLLFSVDLYDEALGEYQQKLEIEKGLNLHLQTIATMLKISNIYVEQQNFDGAMEIIHERMQIIEENRIEYEVIKAETLLHLGRVYYLKGVCEDSKAKMEELFEIALSYNQQILTFLSAKTQRFIKALESCAPSNEEIYTSVLFNIGMVYRHWNKIDDAKTYFERSLNMASKFEFNSYELKATQAIANIYLKQKKFKLAKNLYRQGLKCMQYIRVMDGILSEEWVEFQFLLGKCYLAINKLGKARRMLLRAYNFIHRLNELDQKMVKKYLKNCIKIQQLHKTINTPNNRISEEILLDYYEQLGDLYSECSNPLKSIEFYNKQLSLSQTLFDPSKDCNSIFAPIYRSLAYTYKDMDNYADAITYLKLYLEIAVDDNPAEKAETWRTLAECEMKSVQGEPANSLPPSVKFNNVIAYYKKAITHAETADIPGFIAYCLNKMANIERGRKNYTDAVIYENQQQQLRTKYSNELIDDYIEGMSPVSGLSQNFESDSSGQFILDVSANSNDRLDDDKELPNSSSSLLLDAFDNKFNNTHLTQTNKNNKKQLFNVHKKNELGETLLHQACIKGDYSKVLALLEHGADSNTRDNSGWQPIHEVSNHGFTDILIALVEHGANVNDCGGKYCGGITPLMDATQNCKAECVELLLRYGANPHLKDTNNKAALDYLNKDGEKYSEIQQLLADAMKNYTTTKTSNNKISKKSRKGRKATALSTHDKKIDDLAVQSKSIHTLLDEPSIGNTSKRAIRKLKPGENALLPSGVIQPSNKASIVPDSNACVKIPKKKSKNSSIRSSNNQTSIMDVQNKSTQIFYFVVFAYVTFAFSIVFATVD